MPTSKNFELGSFANNVDHDSSSGDTEISNNITLTGELRGPSTFIIDPAGIGDNTGLLQIKGNLQVDGTTTTINSTTLDVDDLNITIAKGAANSSAANGAGITIDGANATFTYVSTGDKFAFNKPIEATSFTGNVIGTVSDISNHDTDALSEGSTNLYFTDARVTTRINSTSIDALSDVDTTTSAPTTGQTIVWDGAKFVPGDSFSQSDFNTAFAAKNIGDLNDVDTTGITNGQTIIYDTAQTKFIPGTASGGGSGGLYSLLDF